jgi:dolichol-phosphate mannosyltransferase
MKMSSNKIILSVVVPCFNEEAVLIEFVSRMSDACKKMGKSYEIILVDDGSNDSTWVKICNARCGDEHVVGMKLSRNHGHQLALTAGLSITRGDYILIIDADLQDPPELLMKMYSILNKEQADVVYGKRMERAGETRFKLLTAHIFYRLLNKLSEVDIPNDTGDFRLMTRRALNVLLSMDEQFRFIRGMVSWIGFKQVPVMYNRCERFAGQTKYPLFKMIRFAINAITSFSIRPLRIASYLGLIISAIAVVMILWLIMAYFFFGLKVIPGWASLMVVIMFIGASQLFVMGVIGEYLGRLSVEMKRRPLYIIEEIVGRESI